MFASTRLCTEKHTCCSKDAVVGKPSTSTREPFQCAGDVATLEARLRCWYRMLALKAAPMLTSKLCVFRSRGFKCLVFYSNTHTHTSAYNSMVDDNQL